MYRKIFEYTVFRTRFMSIILFQSILEFAILRYELRGNYCFLKPNSEHGSRTLKHFFNTIINDLKCWTDLRNECSKFQF